MCRIILLRVNIYLYLGEPNTKIYSIKFDWQDKYIAAACENGEVRVYNVKNRILLLIKINWHILCFRQNLAFHLVM